MGPETPALACLFCRGGEGQRPRRSIAMLKAISTYIHIRERLHPGILDKLASGGAEAIEIFAMRGHFNYDDRQQVRELVSWFASQPEVAFQSMHAPMFGPSGERFDSPRRAAR